MQFWQMLEALKPNPPQGFEPRFMNMNADTAGKLAAEKLMQTGMNARQAAQIGNQVSQYVWDWSMQPWNVYKRVLAILSDKGLQPQEALDIAKRASMVAKERQKHIENSPQ